KGKKMNWYPNNKEEIEREIKEYLEKPKEKEIKNTSKIHGIVVPHAGYEFSGEIAGKAYSLLKEKNFTKAIILGPSHYEAFKELKLMDKTKSPLSPLGKIEFIENSEINQYETLEYEHSVDNQIPFLQYLNNEIKILPFVVGNLSQENLKKISQKIVNYLDKDTILVISTDLSHFLKYEKAVEKDHKTIEAIKKLDSEKLIRIENSACGIFPLLILFEMCKEKNKKKKENEEKWNPKLIDYKNTGDIIPDLKYENQGVVGYASFVF
ncbi:MAG: AmmeMemoRadiSam system protein B, partial [Minisyncoccales bacterium]